MAKKNYLAFLLYFMAFSSSVVSFLKARELFFLLKEKRLLFN